MNDHLFIYGTLLPEFAPASMAAITRRLRSLGPARVVGKIYDLGHYPAVTVGEASDGFVRGEVVEVDGDDTWRAMDRYEGCPREGEGDGLYRRIRTVSTLDSGEAIECWIYVYNRDLAKGLLIESGCWRTHKRGGRSLPR